MCLFNQYYRCIVCMCVRVLETLSVTLSCTSKVPTTTRHCAVMLADARPAALLARPLLQLCSQMLAPPHGLHWLLLRLCSQMPAPPHGLHLLRSRLCGHFARPFFTAPPPLCNMSAYVSVCLRELAQSNHAAVPSTPSPRCAFPPVPAPSDKARSLFSAASPVPLP